TGDSNPKPVGAAGRAGRVLKSLNAELQALVDDARFMSGSAALASGAHPEVPAPAARLQVPGRAGAPRRPAVPEQLPMLGCTTCGTATRRPLPQAGVPVMWWLLDPGTRPVMMSSSCSRAPPGASPVAVVSALEEEGTTLAVLKHATRSSATSSCYARSHAERPDAHPSRSRLSRRPPCWTRRGTPRCTPTSSCRW